ncbi:hypothetical protein BC830DRAFT_1103432 [Chytriomyces sp. MP71]|nr:hypothetical protein BC830DRAFT_1103432 [Chytriomyces sp. MP71]
MRTDNDERRLKQIQAQLSAPDNCMCADCLVEKSKYAVTNIGAFICARCAELHKRMGPEFSVLKKIKDEKFTDIEVSFMSQQGNRKVNALYCANGPHGPPPPSDVEARIQMITHGGKPVPTDQDVFNFIIDKYKRLKFMKESDRKKIEASRKANAASGKKPTSREIKAKPLEPVIIEPDDHLTFEGPLKLLASMGFTDTSKCIMALKRSKGSVDGAVGLLVNSKESDWKLQTPVGVSSGTAPSKNDDTAHLSKVLEAALEFLEGMGFKNRDQNLDALRKAEGDIEKAVSTLTSSSSATQGFGKTTGASAKQETETSFDMDLLSLVDNGSNCSNESSTPFGGFFGVQVSSQLSTNQGQQDFYLRQMEAQRIQQTQLQAQLWKNQQKVLEQHPQQSIGQAPSIQQPQMNIFFQGQPSVVPQPSNASVFSTVFQPESNDPFAALVQGSKMPQQFATFQQSQTGDSSGGFQNNASPYLAQQAYQQVQHFGYTVGQHRQQVPAYSAVLARQPQQQGAVYSAYSLGQQQQQIPIGVSDGQQVPRSMMGQYSQPAMENQFSNGQTMYQSQEKENSQFQQQQNRQPAYGFRQ